MLIYEPPVGEYMFLFRALIDRDRYRHLRGYADLDMQTLEAILDEAASFSRDVLLPLNASGDAEGCTLHADGHVSTPTGYKAAFEIYAKGGWSGLTSPTKYGGQDMPRAYASAVSEFRSAANQSFDMYTGWGDAIAEILTMHGTEEQRQAWLPSLISGEWGATMGLTEPHAGTDVGMLRTRAVPQPDGSYRITGGKIFNSGGEQDLTENILHFVLARIQGDPPGTGGISLFAMPKLLPDANGKPTVPNGVSCGKVEHKMGLRGSATCVMNYDNSQAWLVGAPRKGLAGMFRLMNLIRRRTGTMALGVSELATQNAIAYTKERLQGRAPSGAKFPDKPADPLTVHPDVRRTLMRMACFNDAARALVVWSGVVADIIDRSPDKAEQEAANERLALITPVIKAYLSDIGFENTVLAQQMYGGHGYMTDTGIEQLVRDIRMLAIAEGANGVQSVDLVLRKIGRGGGTVIRALFDEIQAEVDACRDAIPAPSLVPAMERAMADWQAATQHLLQAATRNPDEACVGGTDYLGLMGLVLLGFMWLRIMRAVEAEGSADQTRIMRARYFAESFLPETGLRLTRIKADTEPVLAETGAW